MPNVSLRPDFPKLAQRFEAWWQGQSLGDRPIITGREFVRPDAPPRPADPRPRAVRELDPAWQLANARYNLAANGQPADTLPSVCPEFASSLGVPSVFAGGHLTYRDETTWTDEMPDIYERDLPDFSRDHPVFKSLNESLKLLGRELGDQALLTCPFMLDGLTTLSLFRGVAQLCLDLLERPADVRRVSDHLDRLALDAHAAWYQTLTEMGHAQTVTWADVYTPGRCEMVQSDFCVNISPAMFDQFVMPGLKMQTDYFDRSCYHFDGAEQWRVVDRFFSLPRIQSVQWQPGDMNTYPMKYIDYLREIRRRGRALWVLCFDMDTPVEVTEALGPDGLMIYMRNVPTVEAFNRLLDRCEQAAQKYKKNHGR